MERGLPMLLETVACFTFEETTASLPFRSRHQSHSPHGQHLFQVSPFRHPIPVPVSRKKPVLGNPATFSI
jgi:hypothetical protein